MFLKNKDIITKELLKYSITPTFFDCGYEIMLNHDLTEEQMDLVIKTNLLDFFYSIVKSSGENFRSLIIDERTVLVLC